MQLNPQLVDIHPRDLEPGDVVDLPSDQIKVLPPSGPVGQTVILTASGLAGGARVAVLGGRSPSHLSIIGGAVTSETGDLRTQVEVPEIAEYGDLFYFGLEPDGETRMLAPFSVRSSTPQAPFGR